jgi:hypothetical protein
MKDTKQDHIELRLGYLPTAVSGEALTFNQASPRQPVGQCEAG